MNHNSSIFTSDAGAVTVVERHLFWGIHLFSRNNARPVNPGWCYDLRIERGIRIGSWCLLLRRTKRMFETEAHPDEWLSTPL